MQMIVGQAATRKKLPQNFTVSSKRFLSADQQRRKGIGSSSLNQFHKNDERYLRESRLSIFDIDETIGIHTHCLNGLFYGAASFGAMPVAG
jgi:hypothetical protein